jgi:crotonobetainyl-CoA:carnitine CoA-transferase CaiB-like acyl-CoA transferase
MRQALAGLKVVDLGQVIAGPFCAQILGDFGAEVIKIEPQGGDSLRAMSDVKDLWFCLKGRNKKCITLNLKSDKGKEIFKEIIKDADILVENFRPGTLAKLGFNWDVLQSINEKLILVSVSGYGQTGPMSHKYGYDRIGVALGGLSYITGLKDGPPIKPGLGVADYLTGLFAALGAMFAVYYRDVQGGNKGQIIDIGLYESVFRIMESTVLDYSYSGKIRERDGNRHPATIPSGHYQAKDGKWLVLAVGNDRLFKQFAQCIGKPELAEDPRFATQMARRTNRDAIEDITAEWVAQHDLQECLDMLGEDVACSPIYSIEDIFKDAQYKARENILEIEDQRFGKICMQNIVPKLSLTPGEVKWTGPSLGYHNKDFYQELGYSESEIEKFKEEGII